MSIGSLDAVHAPWVLGFRSGEEGGRRAASLGLQVGDLKGMEIGILSIGNPRLAAEAQPDHSHASGRVGVRRNHQCPGLGHDPVGTDDIGGGADLHVAQFERGDGHPQSKQHMLDRPHGGLRVKDGQYVKAKRRCELEPR